MLRHLKIKNLALLEAVDLEFGQGFTTVTGETGAGKSVLIGALSLLAGNRAERTWIRESAEFCEAEALLEVGHRPEIKAFLEDQGLPTCEEGCLIVRRMIDRSKPGRASINGALVPSTTLAQLAGYWIDFHGPDAPHRLAQENEQRNLLDAFAQSQERLSQYQVAYHAWREVLAQIEALKKAETLSEDERIFYECQLQKLEEAVPSQEAIETLEDSYARQSKIHDLLAALSKLVQGLGSGNGVSAQLAKLSKEAHSVTQIDSATQALWDRIQGLVVETEDIAYEYSQRLHKVGNEALQSKTLEAQMNRWLEMKRLYGPSVEQVLARKALLKEKLVSQSDVDAQLVTLETEAQKRKKAIAPLAAALDKDRQVAADRLVESVQALLPALGLKAAKLRIQLEPLSQYQSHGPSRIEFGFSANAGQLPLPLGKIASSGEMARVMLAFKAVLAQVDATPLLVFDEVDANVGGEIGAQVGKQLRQLSVNRQVLAVTHLPQVAAQGQHHILVTKQQGQEQTTVRIEAITPDADRRLSELARMLGDRNSASALKHAEALLKTQDH